MAPFVPATGVLVARRYLLRTRIGRGGMGEVWEAEDRELEGPCAVKFILNGVLPERDARSRFTREAKVAARLRSPHAVQILGVGEHEGSPYLAMELLEGESLHGLLARVGRLDIETTLGIVSQIAAVLEKASELGIVHRDLKPDNVWLCAQRDLFIKVFDFGIAKSRHATLHTISGAVVGTPHYMSPEQVQGGRSVDHRTDLWALAVVTIECLTGQRPFEAEALGGLVLKIMAGPGSELRELCSSVSPGFAIWAETALAVEPGQRFQSASLLVDALRAELAPGSRGPSGTQILHSLPRVPLVVPTPPGARAAARPASPDPAPSHGPAMAATSAALRSVAVRSPAAETSAPPSRTEQLPAVARSQSASGGGGRWRLALLLGAVVMLAALLIGERLRNPADDAEPQIPPAAAPNTAVLAATPNTAALAAAPSAAVFAPVLGVPTSSVAATTPRPPVAADGAAEAATPARFPQAPSPEAPAADVAPPPPAPRAVRAATKPSPVRTGLRAAAAPGPAPAQALPAPTRSPASYATNPGF